MLRAWWVCIGLLVASPVAAQPASAPTGAAAYADGRRFYDLREWDKAIERFKEAYKLEPTPASLFNIAQSYRLKGDCEEALGFYRTYRRNYASAGNVAQVDAFITDLEPCAKERQAARAAAAPTPGTGPATPGTAPAPAIDSAPVDSGRTKRIAGLVIGGGGVLLVATGFVFGAMAKSAADDVTNGGDPANPPLFDPDVQARGERYDLLATISWAVGGAAIVGGVVLYVLGRRAAASTASVTPTAGGAVVGWSAAF